MAAWSWAVWIATVIIPWIFEGVAATEDDVFVWKTLHLDQPECDYHVRNDEVLEGDVYMVKSSSWTSTRPSRRKQARSPAECSVIMKFGDRLISATVMEWECETWIKKPTLGIFDTCTGQKQSPLLVINCTTSSSRPRTVTSTGACISIYHYRGDSDNGYYFSLQITAEKELLPFPVGGVASLIVGCMVLIMVFIKFLCVVSGYEYRLPRLNLDDNDQRQIIKEAQRLQRQLSLKDNAAGEDNQSLLLAEQEAPTARALAVGSMPSLPNYKEDYDDLFKGSPKLKRYSSYKSSTVF